MVELGRRRGRARATPDESGISTDERNARSFEERSKKHVKKRRAFRPVCDLSRWFITPGVLHTSRGKKNVTFIRAMQTRTCDGYLPEIMNRVSRLFPTQIFKSSDSARSESSPIDGFRLKVLVKKRLASLEIPKRRSVVAKSPDPPSGRFHVMRDAKILYGR
jgi:hypothetical protein